MSDSTHQFQLADVDEEDEDVDGDQSKTNPQNAIRQANKDAYASPNLQSPDDSSRLNSNVTANSNPGHNGNQTANFQRNSSLKSNSKFESAGNGQLRSSFRFPLIGSRKETRYSSTGKNKGSFGDGNDEDENSVANELNLIEDDCFSNGLPSDLPSGLVDVEGNIIGDLSLHLGQEDDLECPLYSHGHNADEDEDGNEEEMANSFGELVSSHSSHSGRRRGEEQARKLSVISNGRVFTHGRGYHLHNHPQNQRHLCARRDNSTVSSSTSTITQHYYPEGGFGYIILFTALLAHLLLQGLALCAGLIMSAILTKFGGHRRTEAGWLGGCSVGVSLLLSPIWVSICKRKSTRLAAVFGASLYHPQRRAILHLKNQKRKVKEKEKRDDGPPFLDCSCLRSKTLQIILLSTTFVAFGIYTPIFYLALDHKESASSLETDMNVDVSVLYVYIGVAWILGCFVFGLLVVQKSKECRVSRQYLCQVAGIICGVSVVTLTMVRGQSGLVIFACIYGFSLGGYNYSLKIYTYERVRARHFPRAWAFVQSCQGLPVLLGVPLAGYLNESFPGRNSGYYSSAFAVFAGSALLFLADVRKFTRRKSQNSSTKTCETTMSEKTTATSSISRNSSKRRRLSFAFPLQHILNAESPHHNNPPIEPHQMHDDGGEEQEDEPRILELDEEEQLELVKELTCISEEAVADLDFNDVYWEGFFGGECITAYNQIQDCISQSDQFPPESECRTAVAVGRKHPKFRGLHDLVQGVASLGTKLPHTIAEESLPEILTNPILNTNNGDSVV